MSTYRQAGVDIDAGESLVARIKPWCARTRTAGVLGGLGLFGGFFRADFPGLAEPVLVSSVDGVGTKLKLAFQTGVHHTVGQDLVNHCVNDILACGARPLFFLDYFATGRLDVDTAAEVIRGLAQACEENGCALIGGETAEMPGFYADGEYDMSGTVVGVVDKPRLVDGARIRPGDRLLGLPSTGLHTNGYSLARHALFEQARLPLDHRLTDGHCLADALLAVHRSYLRPVQALLADVDVRGISHVTGGGLKGNTRRILPAGCDLLVDEGAWEWPALFRLIQECGQVARPEMERAFNLGIGLVLILAPEDVERAEHVLREQGEQPLRIGQVVAAGA
ncbi:MAG: phosphoribosylformylglycinamidine cyclo-ligase [Candidatus Delongbacteria bacterium]